MVDCLVKAEAEVFESTFEVKNDNIFIEGKKLREFALIENICQTAAAGLSYTELNSIKRFSDGFLGSISKMVLHQLPELGALLETKVLKKQQLGNLYLMHGEVFSNGKLLIECDVKLAGKTE